MTMRKAHVQTFAALAAWVFAAGPAVAQGMDKYPSQPIKLMVPWPPGGGAEIGGGSPADFDRFIRSETVRYESIVRLSGAKVN